MTINAGYNSPPLHEKMIESVEIMGNFTSYYNECATTIIIGDNKQINQNNNCEYSQQTFLDDLTTYVLINNKTFIFSISSLQEIPITPSMDLGLNYFLESKKIFKQFIKETSLQD